MLARYCRLGTAMKAHGMSPVLHATSLFPHAEHNHADAINMNAVNDGGASTHRDDSA